MKMSNEARVGLMITVSFTIFIVLVGLLAKINVSQSGYTLRIFFSFLNDLRPGAPVKIAGGIKIGQVEEIRQTGEKTEVIVWIDNKYKLIKSSTFAIYTAGMIGEKYVNIIIPPIKDDDEFLSDGDKKYGMDPASFDQMMQTFQGFMQNKSGGQILAEIFQNSNKFVEWFIFGISCLLPNSMIFLHFMNVRLTSIQTKPTLVLLGTLIFLLQSV